MISVPAIIILIQRKQPGKPVDKAALGKIYQVVMDYKGFPALYGSHIIDEPTAGGS